MHTSGRCQRVYLQLLDFRVFACMFLCSTCLCYLGRLGPKPVPLRMMGLFDAFITMYRYAYSSRILVHFLLGFRAPTKITQRPGYFSNLCHDVRVGVSRP